MKINFIILSLFVSEMITAQAPQTLKIIREGNELYEQQQYDKAAVKYKEAIQAEKNNITATFNLANTWYKLNNPVEALNLFSFLSANETKKDLKSKFFYNKGVVLSNQQKPEESIDAYKNALRNNPDDMEARENLQKALLELKKKKEEDNKKKQEEKKPKQSQSKISPREAQQRLQLLAQKEKEVHQRIQKEKSRAGGSQTKDW